MPLSIGQVLNSRYRIDALLGQGGMGAVYRAVDLNLNLPVAVKENLDASPEAQKQFGREAGILARLSHPNLPRVTDYFFISGQGQYLVMDYVEGEDLRAMLGRLGVLPEWQLLNWVSQVCDALAYLHSQPAPIIHRDIKPGNIKIRSDGRAILVDFGIAKIYDPYLSTTIGAKAVTPGYSPPEQYGGDTTDARSDIYALGATVYHLLTGQVLPESVQRAVGVATVAPPRQLNRQISPVTEQAILKAIEVATDRRFQNVNELRAALIQPVARKAMAPPPPPVVATARAEAKEKFVPGAAMRLGVFVVGGVGVVSTVQIPHTWCTNS
jgi:serine/threonine protein kinase